MYSFDQSELYSGQHDIKLLSFHFCIIVLCSWPLHIGMYVHRCVLGCMCFVRILNLPCCSTGCQLHNWTSSCITGCPDTQLYNWMVWKLFSCATRWFESYWLCYQGVWKQPDSLVVQLDCLVVQLDSLKLPGSTTRQSESYLVVRLDSLKATWWYDWTVWKLPVSMTGQSESYPIVQLDSSHEFR